MAWVAQRLEVVQQEFLLGRAERGVNGGELLQDVRAVPFTLHHAGDAPDLSPDTGQPTAERSCFVPSAIPIACGPASLTAIPSALTSIIVRPWVGYRGSFLRKIYYTGV